MEQPSGGHLRCLYNPNLNGNKNLLSRYRLTHKSTSVNIRGFPAFPVLCHYAWREIKQAEQDNPVRLAAFSGSDQSYPVGNCYRSGTSFPVLHYSSIGMSSPWDSNSLSRVQSGRFPLPQWHCKHSDDGLFQFSNTIRPKTGDGPSSTFTAGPGPVFAKRTCPGNASLTLICRYTPICRPPWSRVRGHPGFAPGHRW